MIKFPGGSFWTPVWCLCNNLRPVVTNKTLSNYALTWFQIDFEIRPVIFLLYFVKTLIGHICVLRNCSHTNASLEMPGHFSMSWRSFRMITCKSTKMIRNHLYPKDFFANHNRSTFVVSTVSADDLLPIGAGIFQANLWKVRVTWRVKIWETVTTRNPYYIHGSLFSIYHMDLQSWPW